MASPSSMANRAYSVLLPSIMLRALFAWRCCLLPTYFTAELRLVVAELPSFGGLAQIPKADDGGAMQVPGQMDETQQPADFPTDWEVGVRSMAELGQVLTNSGQGVGIVLGVGPAGKFARHFLQHWKNGILYLCDPFIHIFNGYEDTLFNVDDRTHQLNFENLRTALMLDQNIQGRYSMVREFSFSLFRLWIEKKYDLGNHPPRFVYVDNNPASQAVLRDLRDWWQLLIPGGIRNWVDPQLAAVKQFSAEIGVKPVLYLEPWPGENPGGPGWLFIKPDNSKFYDPNVGRERTLSQEEL